MLPTHVVLPTHVKQRALLIASFKVRDGDIAQATPVARRLAQVFPDNRELADFPCSWCGRSPAKRDAAVGD
jgi:hypothetical protein